MIRSEITQRTMVGLVTLALAAGACSSGEETVPMDGMPMDMPMEDASMEGGMRMDPAMMERHADEADAMAAEVQEHIAEMRRLAPEQQHERMAEHVGQVSRMLSLMNRQMDEMSVGMPMDDEQMGAMMGMSAEEHRHMMDEMEGLRTELEEIQTASVAELRQGTGAHLDRCESMATLLESSAENMREG